MYEGGESLRALVRNRFGPPDVLELREVEKPDVTDDGVLVRVRASSVNRGDWYALVGKPWFARPMVGIFKPKDTRVGGDFAGVVEAVGKDVTDLAPGDEVFGGRSGAFAEYVNVRQGIARKPSNLTFEEAAAVPVGALTALQGLRDRANVQPGQKVLINGASGGVGIYAVQIAKALGAEVTAVCSSRNVDLVGSLGADRVVDYTKEDFTRAGQRYDVLLDIAGSKSWRKCKRVLEPGASLVIVGGPMGGPFLGPLGHVIRTRLAAIAGRRKVVFFIAKFNRPDMNVLRELVEAGKVRPVVERRYDLAQAPEALRYMGEGHVQSKLVITV
jgi:NADPH:quinone reductase-like Zn-dependent oxidoreductase